MWLTSIICDNFFLNSDIVIVDTTKNTYFLKHLFSWKQQHVGWKKPQSNDKLLKNNVFQSSHGIKKGIEAFCHNVSRFFS